MAYLIMAFTLNHQPPLPVFYRTLLMMKATKRKTPSFHTHAVQCGLLPHFSFLLRLSLLIKSCFSLSVLACLAFHFPSSSCYSFVWKLLILSLSLYTVYMLRIPRCNEIDGLLCKKKKDKIIINGYVYKLKRSGSQVQFDKSQSNFKRSWPNN